MELMPCQMCSGHAHFTQDGSTAWIQCVGCGMTTGDVDIGEHDGGMTDRQIEIHEQQHDGLMPSNLEAGRQWNRMQSLIAKGLLIEEEAAANRETKGRL